MNISLFKFIIVHVWPVSRRMNDPEANCIPQEIVDLWQDAVKNNRKARFASNFQHTCNSFVKTCRRLKVPCLKSGFMLGKTGVCYLVSLLRMFFFSAAWCSSLRLVIENTRSHTDRTVAQKKLGGFGFISLRCGTVIITHYSIMDVLYSIQIYD